MFRTGNPDPDQNILVWEYGTHIDYRLRNYACFSLSGEVPMSESFPKRVK
jgi:hypothetical protein